ncbi:hypothetical protein ACHAXT_005791 [Thalassiosira profunda]
MFVVALLADTIRIPPPLLSRPTLTSVQSEIDRRYPNRVLGDVGLVVCPYGPPLDVGDGLLVPGDGGAHHQVVFRCVVFRPFVEEVLVGVVTESHPKGLRVRVGGFFENVFVPAYWMLNPSRYEEGRGVWVWTPTYDDDDEMEGGAAVKSEEGVEASADATDDAEGEEGENRFEIEIGAEIRFKVKAVNFTRITTTMKGVQATTTTTAHASDRAFGLNSRDGGNGDRGSGSSGSSSGEGDAKLPPTTTENGNSPDGGRAEEEEDSDAPVRRRSSSADLSDADNHPAPMQIVGSICEDGLGLTSWWRGEDEEEEDGEEDGDGEKG